MTTHQDDLIATEVPSDDDIEIVPIRRRWLKRSGDGATMPAGMVLAIMLVALVVAMFVNADATLRKSEAKRNNPAWRTDVARGVADVADFLHLSTPRNRIDDALGRHSSSLTPEQVLAREQGRQHANTTNGHTVSYVPHLRTPTPADPLKLWVGGDSITETFGTQLVRVAGDTGLFHTTLDYHISTGLCVPTYFNWPVHLAQDVIPKVDPDVVVIMFGANDGQNILMPDGKVLTAFSPEWQAEYAKRVGAVMDLLRSPTNDRLVIWPGPPPMGPHTGVHGMDLIAHIDWMEAKTRPWVHYIDTWVYFSDAHLQYRHYLPTAAGTVVGMRQADDVHMSDDGGTRMSWVTLDDLGRIIDLNGSEAQPSPGDLPPPGIKERTEIPAHVPGAI
jgi:hypothetical protein